MREERSSKEKLQRFLERREWMRSRNCLSTIEKMITESKFQGKMNQHALPNPEMQSLEAAYTKEGRSLVRG